MMVLYLQITWNKTVGICVDTHVHRISNRLKWAKTNSPEQTKKQLESWFPKELWSEINTLFVGFGQIHCSAINPKCASCPVYNDCSFQFKAKGITLQK